MRGAAIRADRRLKWAVLVALGLLAAALAGVYSVGHPTRALVAGVILVVGLLLLDLSGRQGTLVERFRWVPLAWIALVFVSDLRLVAYDPLAVTAGEVGTQHMIQIGTYGIVAALIVRARGTLIRLYPHPVPKGLLLAWPAVAVASALWSLSPLYSLVRSLQLVVTATLALLMVRIWLSDRATGQDIFVRTLRLFVQVVTILAIWGLLSGETDAGRFAWPGMHPGVAATCLGAAFLMLVFGGRSWLRFSAFTYWPRLVLFGVTLILGQTRSVLAGIAIGALVALWLKGREKPVARYLGVLYYVAGGLALAALATAQVGGYLARGQTAEGLTSLSGRVPLWEFAIGQLDSVREWAVGFGYGTSRLVLISDFEWAGYAHSTWIELLLGIGLLGLVLAAASFLVVATWLGNRDSFDRSSMIAIAILAFFLMASPVSEGMALPGIGFGFFALVHVPALARRRLRESVAEAEGPEPRVLQMR